MRNIGLIFRKDFRRFWPLGATAALLAFFLAFFPSLGLSGANQSVIEAAGTVRVLVIFLLAIAVVQEDLVMSDRAAWITRPVTGIGILTAKLLLLLVLLILPFGVITALGAHRYDLGASDAAWVAGDHTAKLLAGTIFLMLLGALTPSLLVAVVAFAGAFVAVVIFQPYLTLLGTDSTSLDSYPPSAAIVAALGLAAVLGCHYSWRQWRWTVPAGILVLVLAVPVSVWIWHGAPPKGPMAGVKVLAKQSRGFVGATTARPFPFSDLLLVGMQITSSLPTDADYYVGPYRAAFTTASRGEISSRINSGGQIQTDDIVIHGIYTPWNFYPRAAQTELDLELKDPEPTSIVTVMGLPSQTFENFRGAIGSLSVSFSAGRRFVRARGESSREPGATIFVRGQRIEIEAVRSTSSGLELAVRTLYTLSSRGEGSQVLFALVNDQAAEVSLQEYGHGFGAYTRSYLLQDYTQPLLFAHRWNRRSSKIADGVSEEWLRSARLEYFVLGSAPVRGLAELTVPDFTMPAIGGSQ